jgi:ATP-dependent Clp protease ATP-binding subunit ClpX
VLPELLGRLPVIVQLDALDEDQLVDVLSGPPDSLIKEYTALLAADDVKLEFADDALRELVRFAVARRVGARGLRGIVEEVCHDLMFEAPERRGETVKVTRQYVAERLARVEV